MGETGPYIQNAVVRARNILRQARRRGPPRGRPRSRRRAASTSSGFLDRRGRRRGLVPAPAHGPHRGGGRAGVRSQEVALLAKHAFAVAQAFHSYYQKPAYSVLYAESDELRAFRAAGGGRPSSRQMQVLTASSASRSRSACDAAARRGHDRALDHRRGRTSPSAATTSARSRPPAACPSSSPRAARGRGASSWTGCRASCSAAAATSIPRHYGESRTRNGYGRDTRARRFRAGARAGRRCAATTRLWLSVGVSRC